MSEKKPEKDKFIVYQRPNLPLIIFIIFYLLSLVVKTTPTIYLIKSISFGSIFVWSWLEITEGINIYRRILGVVVMLASISSAIMYMQHIAKVN
jgi:hypothetical protein